MWHYTRYCIFFASILTLGIITPSAFANTALVNIIPGSGPSDYCAETATCFTPSILHISPGDTVTWTNNDNVDHTIVNGMPYANQRGTIFDSGTILPGKTFSFTFYDPGTYIYSDKIDRWMVGKVIVEYQPSPAVPEFGTMSGLVVLVSIIGVIILTRTFMKS
jgi:predicted secreted protein with PEFG-CTERM motif